MILSARPTRRRVITEIVAGTLLISIAVFFERFLTEGVFEVVTTFIVIAADIGIVGFVLYFTRSNWRSAASTRALMQMAISLMLLLLLFTSGAFLGDYYGRDVIRISIYTAVAYSILRMLYTLRVAQIRATRHPLTEGKFR